MSFTVSVGEADFAALRNENAYYVDKSEIMYELVHDTNNKVTLFTRPRRFGKTLMMSMMENFFSIRKDSKEIFEGLNISKHEEFCREWMNQYPVLFVSFKDAESENFDVAYAKLKTVIADVCKKFADIGSSASVNSYDVTVFNKLQAQEGTETDVQNSLKTIMRMLNAIYKYRTIHEGVEPLAEEVFKERKNVINELSKI